MLDRAFYVGALPLMLAAAALILRPHARAGAVAAFGALWLAVLFGVPPFLRSSRGCPSSPSGHNSRLSALYVLALALLAGWGLDELTAPLRGRRDARLALAAAAMLAPAGARIVIARAAPRQRLRRRARGGLGLRDAARRDAQRDRRALVILRRRRRGPARWCGCRSPPPRFGLIALRMSGRLAPAPFVGAGGAARCVDLFHAGHGIQPGDRPRVAPPARHGGDQRLEARRPRASCSMEPIPQIVDPDAVRALRGARLRPADHAPLRPSLAQPGLTRVVFRGEGPDRHPARPAQRPRPAAHAQAARGDRPDAAPQDEPLERGRGRASPTRATTRASIASRRAAAGFVGTARSGSSPASEAAFDAVTEPGFDPRRGGDRRRVGSRGCPEGSGSGSARIGTVRARARGDPGDAPRAGAAGAERQLLPGLEGQGGRPGRRHRAGGLPAARRPSGAGCAHVEFRYEPLTWRIGWIVSLLALVGLMALVVVRRRRRRRRHPA